jgi:hypothetical protein
MESSRSPSAFTSYMLSLSEAEEAEYKRARNRERQRAKKLGPDAALKFLGLI